MSVNTEIASAILKNVLGVPLYASLHREDAGSDGNQTTNESTYNGYSRIPLSDDGDFWRIEGDEAVNAKPIIFAQSGSGPEKAMFVGLGEKQNGEGKLRLCLPIRSPQQGLVINPNIIPSIRAGVLRIKVK